MIDLAGSGVEKYLKLPVKQKKEETTKSKNLYLFAINLLKMFVVIFVIFFSFIISFYLVYFILKKVVF